MSIYGQQVFGAQKGKPGYRRLLEPTGKICRTILAKRTQRIREATGNSVRSRSLVQPRDQIRADDDVFHATEVNTKVSITRETGGSAGVLRAWHV